MTRTVCIIPARGGSVRVPRKNIREFKGVPMVQRAIGVAQRSRLFDKIVVTTDDMRIGCLAEECGAQFYWRSEDDGTRGTQAVIGEVVRSIPEAQIVCGLYPCTPLLTPLELIAGYRILLGSRGPNYVVSSTHGTSEDAGGYYWGWAHCFAEGVPLEGNAIYATVQHHFDINTPEDWARAESMFDALRSNA